MQCIQALGLVGRCRMLLSLHFKTGFYQIHWVCYKKHPSGLSDKTAD